MFVKHETHLQGRLLSTLDDLSVRQRAVLEKSWAATFRREVFMRIDEAPFAVLYATVASRPNAPVNVLVGLEVLKAGFGWSDEELEQAFMFDLQVRYALGYEQLGEGGIAIRTVYEFRRRLRKHMEKNGEHLLEQAFAQITDAQLAALRLKTDKLRMDSTQIASNICNLSRLELLVAVVQRVHRMLSAADQAGYAAWFAPYLAVDPDRYGYRLGATAVQARLVALGPVIATLIERLAADYSAEAAYGLLVRVWQEHFVGPAGQPQLKPYAQVSAAALQSPADPEATYHQKRGESYRGYVANVTETCHPANPVQLIVNVQTAPNATDDAQLLIAAIPTLVARTAVNTLYTDGGYNSPAVDPVLDAAAITHVQTALRGDKPHAAGLSLVDFELQTTAAGTLTHLICPQGTVLPVTPGQGAHRFIARPHPAACADCPLQPRCPTRPKATSKTPALYFELRQFQVARKRQAIAAAVGQGNPRAAVEATVRSLKHPFRHGKVPVRTQFRVAYLMFTSALMVNARRIHRYRKAIHPQTPGMATVAGVFSATAPWWARLGAYASWYMAFAFNFLKPALALKF